MMRLVQHKKDEGNQYAIAIADTKPVAGKSPLLVETPLEAVDEPMTVNRLVSFIFRFVVGSTTGALFVPIAMYRSVVARLQRRV